MDVKCSIGGKILSLDDSLRLGVGGEGVIYRLPDNTDRAAKIYHRDKMNAERVSKLKAMLANAPLDPMREQGHASIAWPVEPVNALDGNQEVIGFLMPLVQNAHPISDFYDVETRHAQFPLFSYQSLCRTARNLASAVWAIHDSGYVIGDVNESNIMVTHQTLVTLVDTDSFQVIDSTDGRVYRCPVGTELFTPPELHGKNFEEIDRSREHDLFGIAALFFQLLMEGTRPFAGSFHNPDETPYYVECLIKGYFPYGGHPLINPSPLAPPFEMLHPQLQKLFRQCFVDGHADPRQRPDAHTWYQALKASERALITCSRNQQHYYFKHYTHCPWCARAQHYTEQGLRDWDPFPPAERAGEFRQYDYAAAQSSARSHWSVPSSPTHGAASIPHAARPAPSSFSASATTIALGQGVTLNWTIPHAQTVRITDQSGRLIFAGSSPSGLVTDYPTKNKTYHIAASGVGVSLPNPVTISVEQVALPVALSEASLELHQPTSLKAVQGGLRAGLLLNELSVKLRSPLRLKQYLPLNSYVKLRRASDALKDHPPPVASTRGYSNSHDGQNSSWSFIKRF
ncbi:MAG: hypothetical protein QOD00_4203 [Blastocatellia bacterium]|nr:hypothetical protein [Blastocatellia bacterium]